MVQVGQISVKGTIDTTDIDRGTDRINNSMDDIKANVDSTEGSFQRLSGVVSTVAGTLIKVGTVGLAAMSGLASLSPQVAPAMARIAVEMRKLSFALGEKLAPLFEVIGSKLIPGIVSAIDRFAPQIENLVSIGTEGISDIASALTGEWGKIDNAIPKGVGVAVGIALGAPFGLPGMMMGAMLGYYAGDKLATLYKEGMKDAPTMDILSEPFDNTKFFGQGETTYQSIFSGESKFNPGNIGDAIMQGIVNAVETLQYTFDYKKMLYAGTQRSGQ